MNIGAQNRKYRHDQHVFLIAVVPVPLLTFLLQEGPEATVPRPSTDICVGSGIPAWSTDLLARSSEGEGGGSCIPASGHLLERMMLRPL